MTLVATPNSRIHANSTHNGPLRVGIGGPVGSGKTALIETPCKRLRDTFDIFVITNDIYTKEDQLILTRAQALPAEGARPFTFANLKSGEGVDEIAGFVIEKGGLASSAA